MLGLLPVVLSDLTTTMAATDVLELRSEYAVGWGTLTLVNAGLAQGKGRSGLGWWLVSIFLGPIATFLIVILDPVRQAAAKHTGQPKQSAE
jgi:hypothetical protein